MKVAYFVMRYPWRSQTFIAREMRGVCGHGVAVEVHPIWDWRLRPPAQPAEDAAVGLRLVRCSPWRVLLHAPAAIVRELCRDPALLRRGWALVRTHRPRTFEGWLHTLWGALFAAVGADDFRRGDIAHFHGAWATAPATVAATLGALTGRTWSFGAHAYDLHRRGGDPLLAPKLRAAAFVHTSTQGNVADLETRFPDCRAKIVLARRGLENLGPSGDRPQPRAALDSAEGARLLSVGRLVEKKGHCYQLRACRELLRRGVRFRLRIVGEGPLRGALEHDVAAAGLTAHVALLGALDPPAVAAHYDWAHIFWHTGVVDHAGDVDGLPNVIPEAFAHGLPVISGVAGAAAEAVQDGETGLLVHDVTDPAALADAVERLTADAALRQRLGTAGRTWVEEHFLAQKNTRRLAEEFRRAVKTLGP